MNNVGAVRCSYANQKRTRALTFVEILVAGLLMALLFIIGWTISQSFSRVGRVRNYETAMFLANQAIEAVRAARSRELGVDGDKRQNTLLADFLSADNNYDKEGELFVPIVEIAGIEYRRHMSIQEVPSKNSNIESGLNVIRVVVSWKSVEDGRAVDFEIVTAHSDQW